MSEESETESLEEIEAVVPKNSLKKNAPADKVPTKKPRTEAQIKAFATCLEKKKEKAKLRAEEAKRLAEYDKKALEEKVVAKAISIKKKQIKKQIVLDEISDDDTPIEVVKEKVRSNVQTPAKVSFRFI